MDYYAFLIKERRAGRVPERIWRQALADEVFARYWRKVRTMAERAFRRVTP